MSDEGFTEIQLSGKQLVFLFMATTVVAVVIFLSGVMVGRGVRAEAASETEGQVAELAPVAGGSGDVNPAAPQPKIDTSTPPPQPVNDELSYYSRLEKQGTPAETLKPAGGANPPAATEKPAASAPPPTAPATRPAAPPPPAPKPTATTKAAATSKPAAASKPAPAETVTTPPAAAAADNVPTRAAGDQSGYVVQVAALGSKADAAALAQRLMGKGYDAYVVTPSAGGASVFRVRVGRFKTRQEAENTMRRLEKEEKFKPWVTR